MAKVFAHPEHIKVPSLGNYETYGDEVKRFEAELKEFCVQESKCKDAGEIISFPIADGKAMYMVFQYSKLIHIPTYDAYQIPEAHARGLRKDDIVKLIKSAKAIAELFQAIDH